MQPAPTNATATGLADFQRIARERQQAYEMSRRDWTAGLVAGRVYFSDTLYYIRTAIDPDDTTG